MESVQMSVHEPPPAGERWILTFRIPLESEALASRVTVPLRGEPGSVREAVGETLSMRRLFDVELAELPATSLATARKS